jgi:hypothetical protein
MQQHADLAWLFGSAAVPLTLLAQWAGATMANAGSIHDTQAPIGFSAVFMWDEFLRSRAPQGPIRLKSKVLARKASCFPGQAHVWGSIARERGSEGGRWDGRSKFGRADRIRLKLMPQFQAQVPDPLRHQLPAFLPPGRMRAPAIRVLLSSLVSQCRLKSAAMQVEFGDIGGGKRLLRKAR